MEKLSKYFTLEEMTFSEYAIRNGIRNEPTDGEIENLEFLCQDVLDHIREIAGCPVLISSGFRSKTVNKAIGGSENSQHTTGQAADFTIPGLIKQGKSLKGIVALIRLSGVQFDQLILEFNSWIHISYRADKENRLQVLEAVKENGKTVYRSI